MAESVPPSVGHRSRDVETPHGPARVFIVDERAERCGTVVLGHGAGKGTNTPDLQALTALVDDGWRLILVDQPWVVAGKRVASRPPTLDEAWSAVMASLEAAGELTPPLVVGGRSAGARVACRTAERLGADGVLALAFPLVPPAQRADPGKWRTAEAQGVIEAGIPLVVVQGLTDAFGGPDLVGELVPDAVVEGVAGPHGFSEDPRDVVAAVRNQLRRIAHPRE